MLKKHIKEFNELIEDKGIKYIFISLLFFLILFFIQNYDISLWADELFSIEKAQKSFSFFDVIKYSSILDSWPPLFYILLHYYQLLFGNSEIILRAFPFIFNILSLFTIYFFTKALYSKKEAILTCIFFTFSPYILSYGIEIRGYSLFLLLFILSSYFLIFFIRTQKILHLFLFFLFSLLSSLTHYFGLLLTFFQIVYLLFENITLFNRNKIFFIIFFFVLIIYPAIHINNLYFRDEIFKHNAIFASSTINRNTFIIKELFPQMVFNITEIKIELGILYISFLFFFYKLKNKSNKFILYLMFVPLLSINLFAYFFMSFLKVRYFIFLFPLVYIIISYFIVNISKAYFYILLFVLLGLFCINIPNIKFSDDRETVSLMKNFSKDKIIVLHSQLYSINYYLNMFNIKDYPIKNLTKKDLEIEDIYKLKQKYRYVFIIYPFTTEQYNDLFEKDFKLIAITKKLYALSNL